MKPVPLREESFVFQPTFWKGHFLRWSKSSSTPLQFSAGPALLIVLSDKSRFCHNASLVDGL